MAIPSSFRFVSCLLRSVRGASLARTLQRPYLALAVGTGGRRIRRPG